MHDTPEGFDRVRHRTESLGDQLVEGYHLVSLFIIGLAVIWATGYECLVMIRQGGPELKDILLLFIYLEIAAMVGIYFKTRQLPVRFLLYIAITALTRLLAIDIKTMSDWRILSIALAILLISSALWVLHRGEKDARILCGGAVDGGGKPSAGG